MKKIAFSSLLIVFSLSLQAQRYTIRGTVEDNLTGEKLISSNVYDAMSLKGITTNAFGFYSLTFPAGIVKLTVSYIGYQTVVLDLNLRQDTLINIRLSPVINLDEVVISAERAKSAVLSTQMSMTELSAKSIKSLPMLLGEVDVLKALQLLPGVKGGNEGTSGIYVRGGGPDQNLILLDGVPVYNANHLFGFFSVFNPDAIQSVKLITGGFPARYGGRLSSVLDIRMRDGNNKKFSAEGSVGIIASKLTIEGPIIKDKTSFIVSGRRTYIDVLAQPLIKLQAKGSNSNINAGYYFYDLNAKINHKFSDKSRLFLSAYSGRDKAYFWTVDKGDKQGVNFRSEADAGLGWGNLTAAVRWNYVITPKLFSNTTLTYSRYNFVTSMMNQQVNNDTLTYKFQYIYDTGIIDWAGKIDFEYLPDPNHTIRFGYNQIYHIFKPGVSVLSMQGGNNFGIDTTFGNKDIYAHEGALFVEDDWTISPRLKANIGLHFSGFKVQDSTYTSLQPRISARFLVNEKVSIKAAFTTMSQYIHLLTNSTIGLPTDLWLPSTEKIKPERATQYALGVVYEPADGIGISVEGYYKSMKNLIEYKEGASFFSFTNDWQDKIEIGEGRAYGVEILARKQLGKTSGWIGYTLSWSDRKFENISFGEWFPYRYDRRHDVSFVLNQKISDNIDLGITWVYGTGNAVTLPLEKYASLASIWSEYRYFNGIEAFDNRNSYRMPAYHRLDIGINFKKDTKWGESVWSIGAYNVYNRKNAFYLQFSQQYMADGSSKTVLKQYSLFPIIPSISYSFKIK
ncbi:MAG: TonB-dependent receptor [Porphyromonadaceae bacterium]|nr:MAG: TonB-dependent receptor [Porphyromonadaceae bacterium]